MNQIFPLALTCLDERPTLKILVAAGDHCYKGIGEADLVAIYSALDDAGVDGKIKVIWSPTATDLAGSLLDGFDILHIVTQVERDGTLVYFGRNGIAPRQLTDVLRDKGVKLVTLMSCNSLNTASAIQNADVGALVSTSNPRRGATETQFVYTFYSSLGQGNSIGYAFKKARDDILLRMQEDEFLPLSSFYLDRHDFHIHVNEDVALISGNAPRAV